MTKSSDKTNKHELHRERQRSLESLHFWFRNKIKAGRENDIVEVKKSHESIIFAIERCDSLNIPFHIQNKVLFAAEIDKPFSSILEEIMPELETSIDLQVPVNSQNN